MEDTNKILPENTLPKEPSRLWKVITLAVASFLLQSLTWYMLHLALAINPSAMKWVWAAVVAALAISVTTFFMLVNKSWRMGAALIILSSLVYFLISPRNLYVWIGGIIFCIFGLWYEQRVWRESKSRVDFSVTQVISGGVSILLYGIMLLLGFNIYYNVSADFKANPDKYYERLGQQAAKTIPYFTKAIVPEGVSLNDSFAVLVNNEAQKRPEYKYASPFEREVLVNEARAALENQFQITAANDETLADIVAQVAVNKIRQIIDPYQNYLPVIFAILITGLLYTFAFLIRWLILIISWLLFRLLLFVGFFKLEKVQVVVQKLGI
ncbi:MAG: hypothetical protein KW788_04580 [Candidatus Doudnabacteria bacterium]|nr:hypothetical protein [Candidatus Doudnabacteria bacterium]